MGNILGSENKNDVIFEVVETENPKLKSDYSILQNDLIFKEKDINSKIIELKNSNKKINKLKEDIADLEYKINIKDNNNKIKSHEINDLKEKYDELEYNKLDIEEKYLTLLDYKDNYEDCKILNKKLEEELKIYIENDNENYEKINSLNKQIQEYKKFKIKYEKLFQDNNLLKINYDKNKKDYNKLLNDNTLLINDVSTKLNNINLKKQIFDYLQKKYKNEPYVINIMTEDIIQIFKNNVNSLKLKYN